MKMIIVFLFLSITTISFSQDWQKIPNTNIICSNFKFSNKKGVVNYQYFQKGDSLIALPDSIASMFYEVFKENQKKFSEIYALGYYVTDGNLSEFSLGFDKKIFTIKNYKTLVVFFYYKIEDFNSYIQNKRIIKLYNTTWSIFLGESPCESEVHFDIIKSAKQKTKFIYLFSKKEFCEI